VLAEELSQRGPDPGKVASLTKSEVCRSHVEPNAAHSGAPGVFGELARDHPVGGVMVTKFGDDDLGDLASPTVDRLDKEPVLGVKLVFEVQKEADVAQERAGRLGPDASDVHQP